MSDSQKPPREIWVTKSGTDPIVKGLAYVHECAHPNTTNFIDKQSYDQLMQQALSMREALEEIYTDTKAEHGIHESEIKPWDSSSLGNVKGALEQFDEFMKRGGK